MPNADLEKTTGNLFKLAVGTENGAAAVYGNFAKLFGYMPQIAAFWSGLHDDELEHAATLQNIYNKLSGEQLSAPPDNALWNTVLEAQHLLDRAPAAAIKTLDDAYEFAHELEFSEVNSIFKFLTSNYVVSEEQEKLLDMQIARHLKKLMDFSANYGERQWRQGFMARSG